MEDASAQERQPDSACAAGGSGTSVSAELERRLFTSWRNLAVLPTCRLRGLARCWLGTRSASGLSGFERTTGTRSSPATLTSTVGQSNTLQWYGPAPNNCGMQAIQCSSKDKTRSPCRAE